MDAPWRTEELPGATPTLLCAFAFAQRLSPASGRESAQPVSPHWELPGCSLDAPWMLSGRFLENKGAPQLIRHHAADAPRAPLDHHARSLDAP